MVGRILKMFPQDFCPLVIKLNTNLGAAVKGLAAGSKTTNQLTLK